MPYETLATSDTPALVIYALDMSGSMSETIDGHPKIDIVSSALKKVAVEMSRRATKVGLRPRYRVAILAYNNEVRDVFGGAVTVEEFLDTGLPVMTPSNQTDTALAFQKAEELLRREWGNLQTCPAPLICHMTDGVWTGADPAPVARRIMQMRVPDGNVLVENIFLDGAALAEQVDDPYEWPGISRESQLASAPARNLFAISSPIPASYRELYTDRGYSIQQGARLIFPGTTPEMVTAGFVMSGMTPTV